MLCVFKIHNNEVITAAAARGIYTAPAACVKLYKWITVTLYKMLQIHLLQQRSEKN